MPGTAGWGISVGHSPESGVRGSPGGISLSDIGRGRGIYWEGGGGVSVGGLAEDSGGSLRKVTLINTGAPGGMRYSCKIQFLTNFSTPSRAWGKNSGSRWT